MFSSICNLRVKRVIKSVATQTYQQFAIVLSDWIQPIEAYVTDISICSRSGWHYVC